MRHGETDAEKLVREEKEKKERLFNRLITEFFDNQARFHGQMREFTQGVRPMLEVLRRISPKDAVWLKFYLTPYDVLKTNPFIKPAEDATIEQKITAIEQGVFGKNKEIDNKFSKGMEVTINAIEEVIVNYPALLRLIQEISQMPEVKENKKLIEYLTGLQLSQSPLIFPVQNAGRYKLTLSEIVKNSADEPISQRAKVVQDRIAEKIANANDKARKLGNGKIKYEKDREKGFYPPTGTEWEWQQLAKFIDDLGGIFSEEINPHGDKIGEAIADLMTIRIQNLSDQERLTKVRAVILPLYAEIYLMEREKSYAGTKKGENLKFLENLFEKYGMVTKSAMGEEKTLKKDTIDGRIFSWISHYPDDCKKIAKHLFEIAITQGFSDKDNKSLYVNARKAVCRMGENATTVWNELVVGKFGSDFQSLIIQGGKIESEKQDISPSYKKLKNSALFKAKINEVYYLESLIDLCKKQSAKPDLINRLEELKKHRDEENFEMDELMKKAVMQYYPKLGPSSPNSGKQASVFENKVGGKSAKELDKIMPILSAFQDKSGHAAMFEKKVHIDSAKDLKELAIIKTVLNTFQEQTGNKMFAPLLSSTSATRRTSSSSSEKEQSQSEKREESKSTLTPDRSKSTRHE